MPRKKPAPDAPTVHLRRMYVDCRYGQMHALSAFAGNGGFDELTPLVCLHPGPLSSRVFGRFLPLLGTDRSAYAPDLPGYGESDPPPRQPSVADYAGAVGDFLDHLRLRRVDLLGYQAGASVAAELAVARPTQVRRLVLVAPPSFSPTERAAFDRAPWPVPPREDGAHLLEEWQRMRRGCGAGVALEQLAASFADALRAGPRASWGLAAAMRWDAAQSLPRITQPVLVLLAADKPRDAAQPLPPQGTVSDLSQPGPALFDLAPEAVAGPVRAFLDDADSP